MWFKKKAYISGYNSTTAVDGTDWRTANKDQTWTTVSQTLPSSADANKYFYLPALGAYTLGLLNVLGDLGAYWTSSGTISQGSSSYGLTFDNGSIKMAYYYASHNGYRVEPSFQ